MNDQKSFEEFELVLVPGSRKAAAKSAGAGSRDLWQIPRDKALLHKSAIGQGIPNPK